MKKICHEAPIMELIFPFLEFTQLSVFMFKVNEFALNYKLFDNAP